MPRASATLYPSSARALKALGGRLKDARLRRHFSMETVAARAGITRQTLTRIEGGAPSVTMGNYFQVLAVLGLEKDMHMVARDDVLGRRLQDAELPQRQRAPRSPVIRDDKPDAGAAADQETGLTPVAPDAPEEK